jgi:DNA-binding CsgD family transcriptional regulator
MRILSAFDILPLGLVVVRPNGRVVAVNAIANDFLKQRNALEVRDGILTAVSAAHQQVLSHGLYAIGAGLKRTVAFSIARSGLKPISIACISHRYGKEVAIWISDANHNLDADVRLIAEMFDFTPAESLIAAHIMGGRDVVEIAEVLKISSHTVRNHLKNIFAKTNTRRHFELLHILLRSPASLNLSGSNPKFPVGTAKSESFRSTGTS